MPTVMREVVTEGAWGPTVRHDEVHWKEMTAEEKKETRVRYVKRGVVIAIAGSLLTWVAGSPRHDRDPKEVMAAARANATTQYENMSVMDKYETAYITPLIVTVHNEEGGKRILSSMSGYTDTALKVGQSCLQGKAYDTSSSEISGRARGEISAVAAFAIEDNEVVVHPAGSNAPALRFTEQNGVLTPTAATDRTLEANGCASSEGVYVQSVHEYETYERYNEWQVAPPLR